MKGLWLALLVLTSPAFGAVDARDYEAFWLWSGVAPQPVLKQAKTLYILQGQINSTRRHPERGVQFIAQGMSVPRIRQGQVWIVYRAHTLRWPEPVYTKLLGQVQRWKAAGNPVAGIQIDFDARTRSCRSKPAKVPTTCGSRPRTIRASWPRWPASSRSGASTLSRSCRRKSKNTTAWCQ